MRARHICHSAAGTDKQPHRRRRCVPPRVLLGLSSRGLRVIWKAPYRPPRPGNLCRRPEQQAVEQGNFWWCRDNKGANK
ncbi:hypothetical protein MRX96_023646 [Rhipicephalus microplus]